MPWGLHGGHMQTQHAGTILAVGDVTLWAAGEITCGIADASSGVPMISTSRVHDWVIDATAQSACASRITCMHISSVSIAVCVTTSQQLYEHACPLVFEA